MACIEMFNSDQQHHQTLCNTTTPMSPRISFSNDFIDTQQAMKHEQQRSSSRSSSSDVLATTNINVSSNFEFSVSNYNMISADELFSKGRLLPFKDNCSTNNNNNNNNMFQKMTLRDELLIDDEDDFTLSTNRPPKGPIRWKEILGLKQRTHIVSKKSDDHNKVFMSTSHDFINVSMERVVEGNESVLIHEEEHGINKISEELLSEGGSKSNCRDVEIGI